MLNSKMGMMPDKGKTKLQARWLFWAFVCLYSLYERMYELYSLYVQHERNPKELPPFFVFVFPSDHYQFFEMTDMTEWIWWHSRILTQMMKLLWDINGSFIKADNSSVLKNPKDLS